MKICPDCKLEIDDKCNVCPDCGYVFNQKKKDFNTSKKNINKVVIIISIIVIVVVGIMVISSINKNQNILKEKNNTVQRICLKGKYQEKTLITSVIDHYSCENFVSYLIDNEMNLSESNIEELIKKDDQNVYEVIYKYTGSDISKYYHKEINNLVYLDFLADNNLFSLIDKTMYSSYLSRSVDDNNFALFKVCLKGNDTLKNKYTWSGEKYYFGSKFSGDAEYSNIATTNVKTMKDIATTKKEFTSEYYKYSYNDKIGAIALFNKDLFEKAYNGNKFGETLKSYGYFLSYLSLDEIKKYVSFGGKFYKDSQDDFDKMIKEFLNSQNKTDGGFVSKLNYILSEGKKAGYSTDYSGLLDYFVNTNSLSQMYAKDKLRKDIYKTFINQGFKCYSSCSYVKYYK